MGREMAGFCAGLYSGVTPLPFLGLSPFLGHGVLLGAEQNKAWGEVMLLIRRE